MIKRIFIALSLSFLCIQAESFEFLNKSKNPIEIALGNRKNPPSYTSSVIVVQPGKKYAEEVDSSQFPQLLVRDQKLPEIAFLYEFSPKPGKKIFVRILDESNGAKFEPQTFVMNNLSKDDIKLIKTLGKPAQRPISQKGPARIASFKQVPESSQKEEYLLPNIPGEPRSFEKPEDTQLAPQAPPLTVSKSKPQVSKRDALLQDIQKGKQLRSVPEQAPKPADQQEALLQSIRAGKQLRKSIIQTETTKLTSSEQKQLAAFAQEFNTTADDMAARLKSIALTLGVTSAAKIEQVPLGDILSDPRKLNPIREKLNMLQHIAQKPTEKAGGEEWETD